MEQPPPQMLEIAGSAERLEPDDTTEHPAALAPLRCARFEIQVGPTARDGTVPIAYKFRSDDEAETYLRSVRRTAVAAVARLALAQASGEDPAAAPAPVASPGRRGKRPKNVAHPDYYDQYTSPLAKRRFLRLAREGAFPCKKEGILRLVLRSDFETYLANHAVHLVPRGRPEPADETDDILARVGLRRIKS